MKQSQWQQQQRVEEKCCFDLERYGVCTKKKSVGKGKKEIKGPTSYGTVQRAPKRQQLPQGKISRASATKLGGMAAAGLRRRRAQSATKATAVEARKAQFFRCRGQESRAKICKA